MQLPYIFFHNSMFLSIFFVVSMYFCISIFLPANYLNNEGPYREIKDAPVSYPNFSQLKKMSFLNTLWCTGSVQMTCTCILHLYNILADMHAYILECP